MEIAKTNLRKKNAKSTSLIMINKDEGNNVVPTCNEKFSVKQNLFVF